MSDRKYFIEHCQEQYNLITSQRLEAENLTEMSNVAQQQLYNCIAQAINDDWVFLSSCSLAEVEKLLACTSEYSPLSGNIKKYLYFIRDNKDKIYYAILEIDNQISIVECQIRSSIDSSYTCNSTILYNDKLYKVKTSYVSDDKAYLEQLAVKIRLKMRKDTIIEANKSYYNSIKEGDMIYYYDATGNIHEEQILSVYIIDYISYNAPGYVTETKRIEPWIYGNIANSKEALIAMSQELEAIDKQLYALDNQDKIGELESQIAILQQELDELKAFS